MICASVYLLVLIRNLLVHLAEKILLLQPLIFGGITDYKRHGTSTLCKLKQWPHNQRQSNFGKPGALHPIWQIMTKVKPKDKTGKVATKGHVPQKTAIQTTLPRCSSQRQLPSEDCVYRSVPRHPAHATRQTTATVSSTTPPDPQPLKMAIQTEGQQTPRLPMTSKSRVRSERASDQNVCGTRGTPQPAMHSW